LIQVLSFHSLFLFLSKTCIIQTQYKVFTKYTAPDKPPDYWTAQRRGRLSEEAPGSLPRLLTPPPVMLSHPMILFSFVLTPVYAPVPVIKIYSRSFGPLDAKEQEFISNVIDYLHKGGKIRSRTVLSFIYRWIKRMLSKN
jgi:hypothetical protein